MLGRLFGKNNKPPLVPMNAKIFIQNQWQDFVRDTVMEEEVATAEMISLEVDGTNYYLEFTTELEPGEKEKYKLLIQFDHNGTPKATAGYMWEDGEYVDWFYTNDRY